MMTNFLFEIGVEELPALSIKPAIDFMKSHMEESFTENRLSFKSVKVEATPRRLVLMVEGLSAKQEDLSEEITGPRVDIAFLANGQLTPAGLGFLNAKGLLPKDAYKKSTDKGEVIAAKLAVKGALTKDLLPSMLSDMMRQIPFKKRMRWEISGDTFARPVRWMVALFANEYLSVSFADVTSAEVSYGHRYLAPLAFKVSSCEQYLSELRARFVILSQEERAALFLKEASERLNKIDAELCLDDDLLEIVKNLVEYPFVVMGDFEQKYLEIPAEILISEMKAHQKCFAVKDKNGKLMAHFITAAGTRPYDEAVFAKGNARVLRARFEDGAFYFAQDQKKSLAEHALALPKLVFERDLGSVAEKSERIAKVSSSLGAWFGINNEEEKTKVARAAFLLKADLVSGVVTEFPELQGVMGKIYAEKSGESKEVAHAILAHYWPRFADDKLPEDKISAVLAIADRLDTLVGIIGIGKAPKGNKDPFALRRAALGIVRILLKFGLSIDLDELIGLTIDSYGSRFKNNEQEFLVNSRDFIIQRARGLLLEKLSHVASERSTSLVDSVFLVQAKDLVDAFARAEALFALRHKNEAEFESLIQTFKRASNIVKKAEAEGLSFEENNNLLILPAEQDLLKAVNEAKALVSMKANLLKTTDLSAFYRELFLQVTAIKPKLDYFFDNVMVMVDEVKLRNARLSLLNDIRQVAGKIADFSNL